MRTTASDMDRARRGAFLQPSSQRPVLNIAHRGARAFAPENTLEAIAKARQLGADMVEVDVHLTRDGHVIVVHDDELTRCSDVQVRFPGRATYFVSDFTLAEIHQLDAGSWFVAELTRPAQQRQPFLQTLTSDEQERFISQEDMTRYASGRIRHPTLQQCLETADGDLFVTIELKALPRFYVGLAERVVALVEAAGLADRVLVASFDHQQLAETRRLSNAIATAVLTRDRLHRPEHYVRHLLDADAYHPGCSGATDSVGLGAVDGALDSAMIAEARAAGLVVQVWTENDPVRMRTLIEAGVTGIFTDYPNRLRAVIERSQ